MPGREARRRPAPALAGSGLLSALLLMLPGPAAAVLGEGVAGIQADQLRVAATRRSASTLDAQVHTLTLADGSTIREYLNADGRVYAVSWNSRGKPRLDQLLGAHFAAYAEGGRQAMQRRTGVQHQAVIEQGDLVVESTAHLNAHVGRAYLRSLLPSQSARDAIR